MCIVCISRSTCLTSSRHGTSSQVLARPRVAGAVSPLSFSCSASLSFSLTVSLSLVLPPSLPLSPSLPLFLSLPLALSPSRPLALSPSRPLSPSRAVGLGATLTSLILLSRSGTRIRIDNLHYDLTRDDLEGLFSRIGAVTSVELVYDRAGRSEGTAYVTYEDHEDARAAVREFDGANAKGQPIRLSIVPAGGRQRGGKGGAIGAGRPLADRISRPKQNGGNGNGNDDDQDDSRTSLSAAARQGIDRYVPGGAGSGRLSRSRSPGPRRREGGGRRPGERRGGGRNGQNNGGSRDGQNSSSSNNNNGGNRRPRKTQEELDAEMADYFVEGSNGAAAAQAGGVGGVDVSEAAAPTTALAAAPANDDGDEDMIL